MPEPSTCHLKKVWASNLDLPHLCLASVIKLSLLSPPMKNSRLSRPTTHDLPIWISEPRFQVEPPRPHPGPPIHRYPCLWPQGWVGAFKVKVC